MVQKKKTDKETEIEKKIAEAQKETETEKEFCRKV